MRKNLEKENSNPVSTVMITVLVAMILITAVLLYLTFSEKQVLRQQFAVADAPEKAEEEIQIDLPEIWYATVGQTTEIYNSQMTDLCGDITKYNVLWDCEIGENLERKYSLTATEEMVGDHQLTFSVYDNALNLLAEKTCILRVSEDNLKKNLKITKITDREAFSVKKLRGDLIQISFEAVDVLEYEQNGKAIVEMIEKIKAAGVKIPVYVANIIHQQEPSRETFEQMTDFAERMKSYENVYLIPVDQGLDREYQYEKNSLKEEGYAQLEDLSSAVYNGTMSLK